MYVCVSVCVYIYKYNIYIYNRYVFTTPVNCHTYIHISTHIRIYTYAHTYIYNRYVLSTAINGYAVSRYIYIDVYTYIYI